MFNHGNKADGNFKQTIELSGKRISKTTLEAVTHLKELLTNWLLFGLKEQLSFVSPGTIFYGSTGKSFLIVFSVEEQEKRHGAGANGIDYDSEDSG